MFKFQNGFWKSNTKPYSSSHVRPRLTWPAQNNNKMGKNQRIYLTLDETQFQNRRRNNCSSERDPERLTETSTQRRRWSPNAAKHKTDLHCHTHFIWKLRTSLCKCKPKFELLPIINRFESRFYVYNQIWIQWIQLYVWKSPSIASDYVQNEFSSLSQNFPESSSLRIAGLSLGRLAAGTTKLSREFDSETNL